MLKLFFNTRNNFTFNFFKKNVEHIEVDITKCDYIINGVIPIGMIDIDTINNLLELNNIDNKKYVTFLISDCESELKLKKNTILFRTSTNKKNKKNNEFVLPHIIEEDLNFKFEPLLKEKKPNIGFCGYFCGDFTKRKITCEEFKNSDSINTNFIIRDKFWGGKPGDKTLIDEFKKNINDSHFTICNRGVGNFSMRFYEVLSMGRIPILINDNTCLPFEDKINWNEHIFIEDNPKKLLDSVLNFWENSSQEDIIERQKKCYDLYLSYFSSNSYGKKINEILITQKNLAD